MNSLTARAASRLICPMCSPDMYDDGCSCTKVFGAKMRMQFGSKIEGQPQVKSQ
jgi:hypothetical protein